MIKKLLIIQAIIACVAVIAFAENPFDEFTNQITGYGDSIVQTKLDNFTKDLGYLMGGGAFHQGKALGFPGFDVGIHLVAKNTGKDDTILNAAGISTIGLPIVQAEIGLPAKIDIFGRIMSYDTASMVGGGVRYGIIKGSLPIMPSLSVQAMMNNLSVSSGANKFTATCTSVDAMASFNIPIVDPYIGVGMDQTEVKADSSITSLKGTANTTRVEAGINLTLIPFTYLQVGGVMVGGDIGYTAGLGVKF
jgi:opacity protein-like surface antigen